MLIPDMIAVITKVSFTIWSERHSPWLSGSACPYVERKNYIGRWSQETAIWGVGEGRIGSLRLADANYKFKHRMNKQQGSMI